MQLIRAGSIALALGIGGAARADNSFVTKTQIYTDNDHTTVVSTVVAASHDAWRGATLSTAYVTDVVSSASVDVVSNATHQMNDVRHEVKGALRQVLGDTRLSAAYLYSVENDYASHNLQLSLARDLFRKNTTLDLGYALSLDDVRRAGDRNFHRSLAIHGLVGTWTQTLTPATIAQASYSFSYDAGYEASPYRFVPIDSPIDGTIEFKVAETEPDRRFRHAFVIGLNRHLGKDSSLQGDYRLYFDSWGLLAHTIQLRYFVKFRDFTLRLRERFYYQRGADFFRTQYTSDHLTPFVTADRELSTFWSNIVGAKLSWRVPWQRRQTLEAEVKVDVLYFSYLDFALLQTRLGADVEAGLSLAY